MQKLTKAIIAVMKSVKGIEKNLTVGSGSFSYKGVSDKDVKETYSKAMIENGLCILPIEVKENELSISRWTDSYGKNKQSVLCSVTTKYLLLHTSGESQEISGYGHGVDSQDKAAGKATTYAMKYALLYTFMTPTGKIDDSDTTHSEEHDMPQNKLKKKLEPYPPKNYEKAAKSIHDNKCTVNDIKKEYTLSDAAEQTIKEMVLNL